MPTYRNDGSVTIKAGPDVIPPGKTVQTKQFISGETLVLTSVLPAAQTIPFGNAGSGRRTCFRVIAESGEVPVGPDFDVYILTGNSQDVTAWGGISKVNAVDGQRITLRGGSGEYNVTIKEGAAYNASIINDITLLEADIVDLEYIRSKECWALVNNISYE